MMGRWDERGREGEEEWLGREGIILCFNTILFSMSHLANNCDDTVYSSECIVQTVIHAFTMSNQKLNTKIIVSLEVIPLLN